MVGSEIASAFAKVSLDFKDMDSGMNSQKAVSGRKVSPFLFQACAAMMVASVEA